MIAVIKREDVSQVGAYLCRPATAERAVRPGPDKEGEADSPDRPLPAGHPGPTPKLPGMLCLARRAAHRRLPLAASLASLVVAATAYPDRAGSIVTVTFPETLTASGSASPCALPFDPWADYGFHPWHWRGKESGGGLDWERRFLEVCSNPTRVRARYKWRWWNRGDCRCVIVPHLFCVLRFHYERGSNVSMECPIQLLPLYCCGTHSNIAVGETDGTDTNACPSLCGTSIVQTRVSASICCTARSVPSC